MPSTVRSVGYLPFTIYRPDPATRRRYRRRMPRRLVLALCLALLSACASPAVVRHDDVPAVAEPLPSEIKPLTVEQEEQVAAAVPDEGA